MPSHLWLLRWSDELEDQLDMLSSSELRALFAKLAVLASAENPYGVSGVEKLVEKRFAGQRRIRQGNVRMRFEILLGEIVDHKFTYKGQLVIISVTNRRDTYK